MEKKVEAEARDLEMERKTATKSRNEGSSMPQQRDSPRTGESLKEGSK